MWWLINRERHEAEMRTLREDIGRSERSYAAAARQCDDFSNRIVGYHQELAALRSEANSMVGVLLSLKHPLANQFGPYFVDGIATTRADRTQFRMTVEEEIELRRKATLIAGRLEQEELAAKRKVRKRRAKL